MKKLSKKMKQLLTLMLAIAMIVTAVPQTGMQVSAAGTEVAGTNEESKDEGDSDNRTEETPENEDENPGGGITDDEEDVEENPSDENQDSSDADIDSPDSDDEPAGEELEDEKTEGEEIEDEEIPEDEVGDDSLPDETEEDEASETEDDVSNSVQDNKTNSVVTMAVDDEFTVDDSGKLTAYEGSGGDITIPDGVVTIGQDVFRNNNTITSVILPITVETIEQYAFAGCTELTGVTLNDGLVTIGNRAFYQSALGSVDAEGKVSGTLEIPGSVEEIGGGAFWGCTNLKEVIFVAENEADTLEFGPDVASGSSYAFADCPELEEVVLPNRLTTVYSNMFNEDSRLKEVQLGNAVEKIEKFAFYRCSSLQGIHLPNTLKEIEYSAFYQAALGSVDSTGKISGTLEIPGSVEEIGFSAFYGCTHLTEVIFSKEDEAEVLTLAVSDASGNKTFADCPELEKVVLPDRLTIVESALFNGDGKLKEVKLGNAVVTIKAWAFQKCSSLQQIELPQTVTEIASLAFSECSSLESVNLPEGLETIGGGAFQNAALGSVDSKGKISGTLEIPGSVTSIDTSAFSGCTHLTEVIFSGDNEAGDLTQQSLVITGHTFDSCPELEKAVLPNRLKTVYRYMFSGDSKLKEVKLGNSVEVIEQNAFEGCSSLQEIKLPQTLTEIHSDAFNKCTGLKSVNLEEGLVTIGSNAFNMTGISGSLTIPSTVQRIDINAFSSQNLEEVVFANGTTDKLEISFAAFESCVNLKKVLLPDRLKTFSLGVFNNCKKLSMLYIPETVTEITGTYPQFNLPKLVIYGTGGSAAEDYAKQYNIPFKDKSELGLNVTGISLSPKEIVRAYLTDEELSKGEITIQLNVNVMPSTAQNKAVTYKSDNEAVAVVGETSGVVTLTGYGTATITATAVDTEVGTHSATCEVRVLHKWTEEEKEAARAKLYELNQGSSSKFVLIANLYTNLQEDFGFNTSSEDFTAEWRLPYAVQPGENSIYDVILHRDDYEDAILEDMTITGIQIDGITIDGSSTRSVQEGKDIILTSEISYSGYSGEETASAPDSILDYDMIWESAKTANVTVNPVGETKAGDAQLTGVKQSKGTVVTAKLILKKNGEQIAPTNANKGITWFSAQVKVDVIGGVVVDGIKISVTDDAQLTEDISSKGKLIQEDVPKETTYNLTATVSAGDKPVDADDCPLTWTSSDTKVVQVKAGEGGSAVLTVKAETGSATITVSAAKNGGFSTSFKMTLRDSTPRLENANVTLNLYSDKPESIITIRPSDGHLIQENGLRLLDDNASTDIVSTFFNIEEVENSDIEYRISVKSKDGLSTGKHKVILEAKTKAADETEADVKRLPLTIQVNSVKPKVTITQTAQTALNLYERNGTGTLKVVANVEISSITFTPNATSGVYLEQKGETTFEKAGLEGSMSYGFANDSTVDSTNFTKANAKGTLTVKFKGFTDDAAYTKSVTLKTNKTLPKFTAAGITLYPNTTPVVADSAPVIITNKTAGKTLTVGDGYTVTPTAVPDNYKITSQTAEQMPIVQALSKDTKGKTIKFDITNAGWRNGIKATASCSVKIGREPTLSFSNAKVTLNKDFPLYTVDEYKPVEVRPYITGFENDLIVTGLEEIKGKDNNSDNILKKGALLLKYEDGVIKVGIKDKDAEEFKKTKKYTYQLTAATSKGLSVKGTLTVTVSTASPSINLKAGGSIDLANRSGSAITYKITTKNYTDDIDSVSLDGVYSGFFELDPSGDDKGVATVRARDGMGLKMKTNYPLTVKVTYASGAVLSKDVKINPKQSSPKFTTDIKKATLFESAPGEIYGQKIVFSGNTETEVKKIELVSGQNAFDFDYGNDGKTGIIYVTHDAYAKTNKTYKLKFAVTLKDAAVNAAPIYVTVQVKYNR